MGELRVRAAGLVFFVGCLVLLSSSAVVDVSAVVQPLPNMGMTLTWEEYSWGGLTGTITTDGIVVDGSFDGSETTPGTGGFNGYSLMSAEKLTGNVVLVADVTYWYAVGTEFAAGIGVGGPTLSVTIQDTYFWGSYFYSASGANSIGLRHRVVDGVVDRLTVNDTDMVLSRSVEYKVIVNAGVIDYFIDGVLENSESLALSTFNVFLHAAVKYSGTSISVAFDHVYVSEFEDEPQMPHGPIYIDGDSEFILANGVTGGSGTEFDPYVIEGWDMGPGNWVNIWILNTNAHFVVRNVSVHDAGAGGVYLYHLENGRIENVSASFNGHAAVYLNNVRNCSVVDSNLSNSGHEGIAVDYSVNVTLARNEILDNDREGIYLRGCEDVVVVENNVAGNGLVSGGPADIYKAYSGIFGDLTDLSQVSGNTLSLNNEGISLFNCSGLEIFENEVSSSNDRGIHLRDCDNSTVESNVVEGTAGTVITNCGIYLHYSENTTVIGNTVLSNSFDGINLRFCVRVNVTGNLVQDSFYTGLWLDASVACEVSFNNIASNGGSGVVFWSTTDTLFANNSVALNGNYGLDLVTCVGVRVYHNSFVGQWDNAIDDASSGTNMWDNGYPSGGNYWDDYTGSDSDGDGIGEVPYLINGAVQDRYPLTNEPDTAIPEFSTIIAPILGLMTLLIVGGYYQSRRRP